MSSELDLNDIVKENLFKHENSSTRFNRVLEWFFEVLPTSDNLIFRKVLHDCYETFLLPVKVKPIHLVDLKLKTELNWSASPGIPWTKAGFHTRADVAADKNAFNVIYYDWHKLKKGEIPPCTFSKEGLEYPCTVYLIESCFSMPLNEAFSAITEVTGTLNDVCVSCHQLFFGNASQQFQNNIPDWLIRAAFTILLKNMDLGKYQDWGVPDVCELGVVWVELVKYFINTPVLMKNGKIISKTKGVPSGSSFSELIITIVNWIATNYCILKRTLELYHENIDNSNEIVMKILNSAYQNTTKNE